LAVQALLEEVPNQVLEAPAPAPAALQVAAARAFPDLVLLRQWKPEQNGGN